MTDSLSHDKEISLIFVNYRSIFNLSRALRSLNEDAFFRKAVEVIVVNQDDREEKSVRALSEQHGFQLIDRENKGFASGANAGASKAQGKYIAFLNPDIRYHSGSLQEIVRAFQKNHRFGVVGATLLDEDDVPEEWSKGRFLDIFRFVGNNIFPKAFCHGDGSIDWVSGGAFFIKKDLFHRLSGFDENFFLYFEDMDLCKRAREAGYSVCSSESLRFSHQGGKSFVSKRSQKKRYRDSQRKYFKKHRPFWEEYCLSAFYLMKIW